MKMKPKHLLSQEHLTKKEILYLIDLAAKIKRSPKKFASKLKGKTLLMLFEKPSLRTHISFEVAMFQLGGEAIFFDLHDSPLGNGKETIADTAKTFSEYVNIVAARLFEHDKIKKLAANSSVPIINALTNFSHPCQILSDLLTIKEEFRKFQDLKLSYLGDANNNIVHSLLFALPKLGINITICCPNKKEFLPRADVVKKARKFAKNSKVIVTSDIKEAAQSHIIYTDSWMSYHIPKAQQKKRIAALKKYQVNQQVMKLAAKKAIFMHCLPATRGMEVTAGVMDGKQSIVFDQAENRMHMEKAILLWLLK